MALKVYLAARYCEKQRIAFLASQLRALNIEVTSTWIEESHPPNTKLRDIEPLNRIKYAKRDLKEIDAAHWFVFFSLDPETLTPRGGRHVEFGYALAIGKSILVVGPYENIFHYIPEIRRVDSWAKAKEQLVAQNSMLASPNST